MGMIELTFLGTTAGVPTKQRNHPAIYLRYQGEKEFCCLLDCGEGTQRQIFQSGHLNFMRLSDIFISHWHADHYAGLLGIMETMNLENRKEPLRIYGPEAKKFVSILLSLGYKSKSFPIKAIDVEFEGTEIQTILEEEEFIIQSIPMKHGIPAVAYAFVEKDRIKVDKEMARKLGLPEKGPIYQKLKTKGIVTFKGKKIFLEQLSFTHKGKRVVYTGDTKPNMNTVKIAHDADLLIHDSTYFEQGEYSWKHAMLDDVVEIAEQAEVKSVVLTHISRRYQDLSEIEEKVRSHKNFQLARDFMKVIV